MNYAKIKDGAIDVYPYTIGKLRQDNPTTSFPEDSLERADVLTDYNIVNISDTERPSKLGWITSENTPTLTDGVWSQVWTIVPKVASDVSLDECESVEMPVQEGSTAERTEPVLDGDVWKETWVLRDRTWLENRVASYGEQVNQIEFITENGLEAWQTKVAEIKAKYPKS